MNRSGMTPVKRGSASLALPLLVFAAAALGADIYSGTASMPEASHIDAGSRLIMVKPATFDNLSGVDVGGGPYPNTGGNLLLWGGGATVANDKLRVQASGWTGSLSATQGSKTTTWALDLAALTTEQRYPYGAFTVTAGASIEAGLLRGSLDDDSSPGGLNRVEANLWGYGITAGVRWPSQTKLGFSVRTGWLSLQGDGTWHGGAVAAALGSTHFDLGGPNATAQMELSF